VFVPDDFFTTQLGGFFAGGIGAMLVMMALGIPLYVCATASVPMAMELMAKGISPGAALVFLMTGPASNAAGIAMIWKVMGPRAAILYLLSVAGTALASGLTLDYIFQYHFVGSPMAMMNHEHHMGPALWESASAVLLLLLLGYAIVGQRLAAGRHSHKHVRGASESADAAKLQTMEFEIVGMTCTHCAAAVEQEISKVAGVKDAEVTLADKLARITGDALDYNLIKQAIENAGYGVKEEKKDSESCGCNKPHCNE